MVFSCVPCDLCLELPQAVLVTCNAGNSYTVAVAMALSRVAVVEALSIGLAIGKQLKIPESSHSWPCKGAEQAEVMKNRRGTEKVGFYKDL